MMYFDRDGKHNFVDENNVVLGYDSHQDCCEYADWYVSASVPTSIDTNAPQTPDGFSFEPYRFDRDFFKEIEELHNDVWASVFRIVADGLPDMYIVLFNSHNGYYSHGFSMDNGGTTIRTGSL